MDLPIALKSLLATLTTKTDAADTDGVMLANISNGTPNGKISKKALASTLSGSSNGTISDLDNASYGWSYVYNAASPSGREGWLFQIKPIYAGAQGKTTIQLFWDFTFNTWMIRLFVWTTDAWTKWKTVATNVPAFYNSYANLAALATGIMGQNISSITAAYFQGTIAQAVFDNVFIAVTRLSDTYPLAIKPKDWSNYSSASAYHVDGVLLVSGDKHLVIAPSEATLRWGADSDSHAASGNTPTSDRDTAMATFDGKTRTNTAVQVSEYSGAETAPGYCHSFTTVTSAYDTTKTAYARRKAGMWWLPSLGEMMMILSNMTKINQLMTLIGGTPWAENWYCTSTEISQTNAWTLYLSIGNVYSLNKKSPIHVRPVCAY